MLRSECNLKMHVRNLGYPIPLQIGGPKPPFSTTSQHNGKLKAYIFKTKHDTNNRPSALATRSVVSYCIVSSQNVM